MTHKTKLIETALPLADINRQTAQEKMFSNTGLNDDLEVALGATEASFHVHLIATFDPDLVVVPAGEDADSWLAANHPNYDQFPVRQDSATVGVLLRQGYASGRTVEQRMRPLNEEMIVSADMPIADLIPLLRKSHFRLVLRGNRLDGLVTQSDLLRLPARMLLFGLITHLELCLRALIKQRKPWPVWWHMLSEKRREKLKESLGELTKARFEPDALEVTNFSDAVHVLAKEHDLDGRFVNDMHEIKRLRNDIAHAKTFVSSPKDVADFVGRFESLRDWIGRITELVEGRP